MSDFTINDVLTKLRAVVSTAGEIPVEQVKLRAVSVDDLQQSKLGYVLPIKHPGGDERLANGQIRCHLLVEIGLLFRIDATANYADTIELQVNEAYEPIHAALETLESGDADSGIESMHPDPHGAEYDSFKKETSAFRAVVCGWVVTYIRTLGQTNAN